jgi:hypothetical protein
MIPLTLPNPLMVPFTFTLLPTATTLVSYLGFKTVKTRENPYSHALNRAVKKGIPIRASRLHMSKLPTLLVRPRLQPNQSEYGIAARGRKIKACDLSRAKAPQITTVPNPKQALSRWFDLRSKNERDYDCLSDRLLHFTRRGT